MATITAEMGASTRSTPAPIKAIKAIKRDALTPS